MKFRFIVFLLALWGTGTAQASSPIILDIATREAKTLYYINGQNKSADEVEAWCRSGASMSKEILVHIRPDAQTPFSVVFDVLQRLKRARVSKFHLVTTDPTGTQISLSATTENIQPEIQNLPRQVPY